MREPNLENDYHVVRDKVQAGIVHLLSVASKHQVDDIPTKSLHTGPFNNHKTSWELLTLIYFSLRGMLRTKRIVEVIKVTSATS